MKVSKNKSLTYVKRMVNIHNMTYVVHVEDIHLIKPRIFASKAHTIDKKSNRWTAIVLVTDTWKK